MLGTVEGVYKDGKVELQEVPPGVRNARVLVVFLPEDHATPGQMIRFGQFKGADFNDEDFRAAEWRGENEQDVV